MKANKELVSGREADVGLKLGYKTGTTLSLRQDRAELDALTDSNASVLLRIKSTTKVLDQIRTTADKFMDALIATPMSQASVQAIRYQAETNLDGLISSFNTNVGGQFIFGGLNSQEKPLNSYAGGAAKAAVDAAFTAGPPAGFGFGQNGSGRIGDHPSDGNIPGRSFRESFRRFELAGLVECIEPEHPEPDLADKKRSRHPPMRTMKPSRNSQWPTR